MPTQPTVDAETPAPAVADARVWYRSSEGCPDGEYFLAHVGATPRRVTIARAGDHVDFVVTVGLNDNAATGRLERQTDGGTIAMSEVQDTSCIAVTDALALSLGLSLTPEKAAAGTVDQEEHPAAAQPPPVAPATEHQNSVEALQPVTPPHAIAAATPPAVARVVGAAQWQLAVQGEAVFGLNPSQLWGGQLQLERRSVSGWVAPWAIHLGLSAHHGREATFVGRVEQWLVAARAGGCPVVWLLGNVHLAPCVDLDLGAVSVTGTRNDVSAVGLWAAAALAGRVGVTLAEDWEILGQVALRTPLNPYEIYARGAHLYGSGTASVWVGLGLGHNL